MTSARIDRGSLFAWPARRPGLVLAATLVLCALAALSASRMRPSTSLGAMLGSSDAAARALERVLARFDAGNELLVLVTAPDDGGAESGHAGATAERLAAYARRLEGAINDSPDARPMCKRIAWRADRSEARGFLERVLPAGAYYLDDEEFGALLRRLSAGEMRAQVARNEAAIASPGPGALDRAIAADPLRLREFLAARLGGGGPLAGGAGPGGEFLSRDGRALLVRLTGARPSTDLDFAQEFSSRVEALARQANAEGLHIEVSGAYAIAATAARSIRADMIASNVSAVVLMQVLFLVAYRGALSFAIAFVPIGVAILAAFGAFCAWHPGISPLSAVIGAAIAGMGIDYSIHYLSGYGSSRRAGDGPVAAAARTGRTLGPLLLAACATSMVAFGAVLLAGVSALQDFAVLGALGLALALASVLVVLPAVLAATDRLGGFGAQRHGTWYSLRPLIGGLGRRGRATIATSSAALLLAGIVVLTPPVGVPFETDLTVMHPRPNAPLEAQARIGRMFAGAGDSLIVHLTAPDSESLVALAHEVDRRLRAPALGVAGVFGPATLLPDPALRARRSAELGALDAGRIIADFRAALEGSIFDSGAFEPYAEFLRELLSPKEVLPDMRTLREFPSIAGGILPAEPGSGSEAEAVAVVSFAGPMDDARDRDRAVEAIRLRLADLPGATPTGIAVVGHDLERVVRRDLPRTLLMAAGAVVAMLLLYFRRAADAGLSLIPAVGAVLIVLAYMHLAGERFNTANLVAMPLLVGLAVDNGIYLTGLARASARRGESPAELAREFASSGHAIFMVGATTILAFGSMMFTSVPAIQSLGRVFAVGTAASMGAAFFLLMPLLLARAERTPQATPGP